ncbi:alcohol dehydrogenase catalytic domain-containing protein [Saccharopolyspora sp. NPDC049357]|uniref:alcohol dehydrogenase catalytic domain-containing protein n=1 Tax=Saccharopolyspora sp. NPDC049357 TaxID=3154507 RepID=UPI00342E64F0
MTVARFPGEGAVHFERQPVPALEPGLVRVRAELVGLCGSDKRLLKDGARFVPGHEIVARVTDTGTTTADFTPGDRVLVYIPLFCGQCRACLRQDTNRCLHLDSLVGWHADGGFREFLDLPPRNLIPVPDDVPSDVAVLALDTVGTAGHGLRMARRGLTDDPDHVVVVGCGPLGVGAAAVSTHLFGCRVLAGDLSATRLAAAAEVGAEPMPDDLPGNAHPLVIEASGSEAGRRLAWELVEPGGVLLLLGEGATDLSFPMGPRWRRTDMTMVRSFYFPLHEVDDNWALLRSIGANLARTLCVRTDFADLEQTYRTFGSGEQLKPLVRIPTSKNGDPR